MLTRSKRMVQMSVVDSTTLDNLATPKYESTKGVEQWEIDAVLKKKHLLFDQYFEHKENISDRSNSILNNTIKATSESDEGVPTCYSTTTNHYIENDEVLEKKDAGGKITVLSDVVLKPSNVSQRLSKFDGCFDTEKKNLSEDAMMDLNCEICETPTDPYASSGTEYFPSDESDNVGFIPVYPDKIINDSKPNMPKKGKTKNKRKYDLTDNENYKMHNKNDDTSDSDCDTYFNSNVTIKESNSTNILDKTADKVGIVYKNDNEIRNKLSAENDEGKTAEIEISQAKKKPLCGRRIRDKIHCCYFCHKIIKQMAKHLETMHSEEMDVIRILALDKKSPARKLKFVELLRVGDYYHNCEVLTKKEGQLILVRRPSPKESVGLTYSDYGPCPECLGFMLKKHLWHHVKMGCPKYCKTRSKQIKLKRSFISESTALIYHTFAEKLSTDFCINVLVPLKCDVISLICKQDNLILKFGTLQYEKYHNTQLDMIRQSMRQLGRLVLVLRKMDPTRNFLVDWLQPETFDIIVGGVKQLSSYFYRNANRPQFTVPSLALKLGYSLKKCVTILRGQVLRKADSNADEKLKNFLHLMELEWHIKISSNALATLHDRKLNAVELLPLTSDLIKLNKFLNRILPDAKSTLQKTCNSTNFHFLATVVLSKIILFNKRRSGEASKMTLLQYASRPDWSQVGTDEFKQSMSPIELELSSKLTLIQIKGKRENIVNVLLTPDVKQSIDLLISSRDSIGIANSNPYIFARSGGSDSHLRGHKCLRDICSDAKLDRPELVTGTKLRKYIATVCQIFNLTENETDWLARHLGHDVRVHREFYRMQESSVELTKISRILLAIETGEAHKFHGKPLTEIQISDLPDLENEVEQIEDEGLEIPKHEDDSNNLHTTETKAELGSNLESKETKKCKKKFGKSGNRSIITKRKPWTTAESNAVLTFFRNEIKRTIVPGKLQCNECKSQNLTILCQRSWTDIKYFVYNYLKKINK